MTRLTHFAPALLAVFALSAGCSSEQHDAAGDCHHRDPAARNDDGECTCAADARDDGSRDDAIDEGDDGSENGSDADGDSDVADCPVHDRGDEDVYGERGEEDAFCPVNPRDVFDICGEEMTGAELEELIMGNLFLAAGQHEAGFSGTQAAIGFTLGLVRNGIDFGTLGSGRPAFRDNAYVFENGDAFIGVRFVFAEDAGAFKKGTPITYDIFSPDSFITDIDYDFDIGWGGVDADIHFVTGPLYELIHPEIEFDSIIPTNFSIKLRTELIAIQVVTQQDYALMAPMDQDDFTIHIDSTPVPLVDLKSALESGGIGLNFTDTSFHSDYFDVDQVMTSGTVMLHQVESGSWSWEGPYESIMKKRETTLFYSGMVSTIDGSWGDAYCDAALTERLGRARHNSDLSGGTFTFENGYTFDYSLREIPSMGERFKE